MNNKGVEALVWVFISLTQLVVGTKLITYPESATVYDYLIVLLVSVPLLLELVYKTYKGSNNI